MNTMDLNRSGFDLSQTILPNGSKEMMLGVHAEAWMGIDYDKQTNELMTNPALCDLREIVLCYQSQPELLKLILMSKVEEDKRRTEEARLKAKELDIVLHRTQELAQTTTYPFQAAVRLDKRPSVMDILMEEDDSYRRDSALGSSFDGSSAHSTDELEDPLFSPTAPMLPIGFSMLQDPYPQPGTIQLSSPSFLSGDTKQPQEPSRSRSLSSSTTTGPLKPRKRREMQAISKIVETREHPYIDGFFWKNNGNTVQKKTGNKSIYYKCSNSAKGCPVNKTVTAKNSEEYLIKYRGYHLPHCGKVQRIVDV
ncbi:hypothetical protein BY458DRAFT_496393 [Sporodiniella umbellata]|nr:hypothetical protein BY458DRAFT_496393 [Sporodiniella umbellata]